MSVKFYSFSVGNGDMFLIVHNNNTLSIIDCNIGDEDETKITNIISHYKKTHKLIRFISTHPDDDHIKGIDKLYKNGFVWERNFYYVQNDIKKNNQNTDNKKYIELKNSTESVEIFAGLKRAFLNKDGESNGTEYKSSSIEFLWPELDNPKFKKALENASKDVDINNICPIIRYEDPLTKYSIIWFGDLSNDFMENISSSLNLPKTNIAVAPHHGRTSGKLPNKWLKELNPDLIIIGEAESKDLVYYDNYRHICQNSSKGIEIVIDLNGLHFYCENKDCKLNKALEKKKHENEQFDYEYIGFLKP